MAMSNPFEEVIKHGFVAPQAQMLDFRNNSNLIRTTNMTHSWFFLFLFLYIYIFFKNLILFLKIYIIFTPLSFVI
jgi:hypothetical protein